ncbi:MAG: cell division protein ZapA [Zetaproteobacteria bacterium]|nr:cell division protein ZapA [Zetaproteobacteria bacterium]
MTQLIKFNIYNQHMELRTESPESILAAKAIIDEKVKMHQHNTGTSSKVLAIIALSLAVDLIEERKKSIDEEKRLKSALDRVSLHAEALADMSLR